MCIRNCSLSILLLIFATPLLEVAAASRFLSSENFDMKNSSRDYSSAFMKRAASLTGHYCSCGLPLLQSRYCKQDFVILAEVDVLESKPFYGLRGSHSSSGWPYSGASIPIKVLHSVKGSLRLHERVDIYFIQGTSCGITNTMFPRHKGKYLLSGFRIEVPGCKDLGPSCHLPAKMYLVTRCGWSQEMEDLTVTQIAGLFLKMYSCGERACSMQPSFTKPSGGLYLDKNTCYYDYQRSRCYSRFSICTRVPMRTSDSDASVCTLRAIRRVPATPQLLQHIPPHLHHVLNQTQFVRTNDEERFSTCLRFSQQGPH
ncbi:conserved hypothetical protein [Echinococcus multilocularis]|uniref:Uncharacterized protein n=1 Tax=Echinococcus multilocularis TaxID=6211 RepID=A0A087W1W5_ECHMU|nr:conserved hypothetical protein [Echinococcus multilocularis]